ncbi:neuroblast differentiation-associated protein AHNAK [Trachinotus anak]|uniref:neuroblast differentiation-associated protein AHNAK n=1 Tax=Trachinotus anak TaxID=443729 RepID=UPI0039F204D0
MFEKRSTPKMSKLKEVHSPESGVIVKTAKDGCAEGLIYGGGKEGIFIKQVVPESPASKNLKLKEGDQILSATVYFDNVSYEDAIQILEHAQAYKLKLCLKRKPDITETEPAIESDVIPEEELYAPEMREQGKNKRRGDARISWPKFPSFGKGRKSRFTRSHSSSEADEQRKLELSPTTSDTESPIKSQDALKGKKKHKMKLSALTKRGRISSSEDQDTDVPTTGQTSGDNYQTASDMLSPECLESLSGETPELHLTEDLKAVGDLRPEQNDQKPTEPLTGQHKVELISLDSTLKTEDLTVALADQESPSGIKSPSEKKKKEKSELKMKILGKDKSHKKDAKAKASPKRLKTLGASIETADQPENEKSNVIPSSESCKDLQGDQLPLDANTQIISSESSKAKSMSTQMEMSLPKVELNISDVTFIQKSPKKGEEKPKKGKDIKQKQEKKTGPTFKLPKIGLTDIATEETTQKVNENVQEWPTKMGQLKSEGTEVKEDPYDKLLKSNLSKTQLPKREDIEIPGMEDKSVRTKVKRIKEPKAILPGRNEEIQSETLQMSIDVDSVKEAVSKLPGFKLPKVDTSGVPIPEEITVIDANAQRISVKTPTKVVDTKTKHEAHFTMFDITASPEISKTTVKLPKITTTDLTSDELLTETKVDLKKPEKESKTKPKQSDKQMKTEVYKREDIIIPGKESAQEVANLQAQKKSKITTPSFGISKPDIRIPNIGIDLPKQNISDQKGYIIKGERTILLQEVTTSKTETKGKGQVRTDVKIPEIDSIEYIDSVAGSPAKMEGGISLTGFGVDLDARMPKADISFPEIKGEVEDVGAEKHTIKLVEVTGGVTPDGVNVPRADMDVNIDGADIKILERGEKGSKFKMPNLGISMPKVDLSLSKKDVTLPEAKAEVKLLAPGADTSLGGIDVSIPEQKMEIEKSELEIKPLQTEGELDGQGSRFKMPKLGIKMPKIKGPELDLRLSKKSIDITLPESKADGKLPEAPDIDPSLGNKDVSIPTQKMKVKKPELEIKPLVTEGELDGQESKFKMPKLGITMPKIKGPEFDLSMSKKDVDVTLPEAKARGKLPDAPDVDVTLAGIDVSIPEQMVEVDKTELEIKPLQTEVELDKQGSKFKMPKLGITMPKVKGPEIDFSLSKKERDITLPDANAGIKLPDAPEVDITLGSADVSIPEKKIEVEKPELEIKPLQTEVELDGQGSKFKMPKFGIKMPKLKGPESDLNLPRKDVDVTLPEGKAEVKLPDAPEVNVTLGSVDVSIPEQKMDVKKPALEIKPFQTEGEFDGQGSKFKMPKLGIKMPKIKGPEFDFNMSKKDVDVKLPEAKAGVKLPDAPEVDVTLGDADISIPEKKIEVEKPELEIKPLQTEVELDGQGSKFKMPKFGIKMPKLKGPEFDLNLSSKDVDVTLPAGKAEVNLPDAPEVDVTLGSIDVAIPEQMVEAEKPELEIKGELGGQGSKLKLPKFGIKVPKIKGPEFDLSMSKKDVDVTLPEAKARGKLPDAPDVDVTLAGIDVSIPEQKMGVKKPELEIKPLQIESELDGQESKLKMPKLGITMPKVKGPEIDFSSSKKEVDLTLPEAKAEVKLPDVELKDPSAKVEIKAPEIKGIEKDAEGSPSKFKMPTFKLPKFGAATRSVNIEVSSKTKDIQIPETQVKSPEGVAVDIKAPNIDIEGPSPDRNTATAELDGKGSKFKMPKFGISLPKGKGPEIDLNLSQRDVDVTLPEADIKLPEAEYTESGIEVEVKAPEIAVHQQGVEGSPSKFKMPSFKLPKFGVGTPKASAKVPDMNKDAKIDGTDISIPDEGSAINISAPNIGIKGPSIDLKTTVTEQDGKENKFKMPHFGFSMPKGKGPKIDLSLSKKDVDVTLPEAKADVKLPEVHPGKVDVSIPEAEMDVPEAKAEIKLPEAVEMKPPEYEAEVDGHGGKFKIPKFGIKIPKVKGPEFDLSFPKKDVDFKLPETNTDVKLPDAPKVDVTYGSVDVSIPEQKMEIEKPTMEIKPLQTEVELEGQGSKFKMPKFGMSMEKVKGPEFHLGFSKKDVDVTLPETKADIDLPDVDLKKPSAKVEIEAPEIDVTEGSSSKFKMPHFNFSTPKVKGPNVDLSLSKKDVDVTLPEAKAEVKLPDVELKKPSAEVEIKPPEIKVVTKDTEGSPSKFKMPTFKLPKFGAGTPSSTVEIPVMEKDIKIDGDEEVLAVTIAAPSIDTQGPSIDIKTTGTEREGKGSKFKLPSLGFSVPHVKEPDVDLSLSKKHTAIPLPDTKTEVKLPEVSLGKAEVLIPEANVEVKKPEVQIRHLQTDVELEGQGSKFKMPKFGITMPKVKGPEFDLSFSKKDADVTLPKAKAEVEIPEVPKTSVDVKPLECDTEIDGQGTKFKLPKFGITMPEVKGPGIDLSLSKKDVDVTLPEAKAEVKLPDVELKDPSAKVEIKASEIKADLGHVEGSPSKFKLPTFKLPKFGAATPHVSAEVPDIDKDIKVDGAGLKIPKDSATVDIAAQNIDIKGPSLDVKVTGTEGEGKGSKFKVPKFGISLPKVQGPEIDSSLSKKDVGVKLPEANAEVKLAEGPQIDVNLGEVDVSIPETKMEDKKPELDGQGSKFKMPKFGMSMPKVKGPEIDFSLSKTDVDIPLPEGKAEVSLPDVELKEPSGKVEVKAAEIEAQLSSAKGSPSKFKLPTFNFPKFGVATPKVSAEVPYTDKEIKIDGAHMHISAPYTDIDVPEVKAEVCLPEVEVKEPSGAVVIEQPGVEVDAKLKKPRFSLPRFSFSKPNVKTPEVDVSPQDVKVAIPEGKVEVKGGELALKPLEAEAEVDGQGNKFKMPKFGITMPKVTGPEIDISLSKKDVDVTLPEAKAEVKLPDVELKKPSAEVEIKPPEIKVVTKDTEGSPSKFKMPTFKLPKFGAGTPSSTVEVPAMDKDIKIDGDEEVLAVTIAAPSIDTQGPSIDIKSTGTEREGKGSKFKLPSLGFSAPHVKGPDVDLSLSKKDVDVTPAEVKADVQLPDVELKEPSAKVEIKAPGMEVQTSNAEGSPSKFKMPTFKLPKFGAPTPQISVEIPDVDRDIKVDGADLKLPEAKAEVKLPDVEIKEPVSSVSVSEAPMAEIDANAKKTSWTLPRFSFSKTSVKSPEADVNLDTPKVGVTLPEAKTEMHPPDIDIKESSSISVDGATTTDLDAKLKKPRFSLPKFSFSKQSTKELDIDVSRTEADVSLPEGNVEVISPEVELKPPEGDIELDGQESKFKMPRFGISMPKVKGPEFDLSFSKKDADVTLPEAKAEVQLSDVKTKQPSAKVEIKAPEIEAQTGNVEASPSKLKMPTFTLPKFGAATPKVSVQVPDVDKGIKIDGAKPQVPKEGAAVDVTAPSIDTEGLSVDVKAKGSELEGSGSKFKMPHFGISKPKVKGPEIDLTLSKKGVDVTLSEAKPEVTLPSVEVKEPDGASSEPDTPTAEVEAKLKRPNWTFPKFSFSRTGGKAPDADVNLETPKADVTSPEAKAEVCVPDVEVKGPSGAISMEEPPAAELDANLKKPKFSLPRFSFAKTSVTLPEVSAEPPQVDVSLPEGEVKVRQPAMEMKTPELEAEHDVQGSKFKLPKFGIALPKAKGPEVDLNVLQKDVDVTLPEFKAEVKLSEVQVKESSASVDTEAKSKDIGGSPLKFKMPTLKMPKLGGATYDVTVEGPDEDKTETDGAELQEDAAINIKGPSVNIKTDMSKTAISDSETQNTETDGVGHGSPSKFKLPSFKMPKLSFSRPKPEDEHVPGDNECKEDQLKREVEPQEETKSPKLTLTSFGEILKNIDVEFDVPKTDQVEENLETLKEVHETGEQGETNKKQDTIKSPERTGWFKFPKFGLSSPSEPAKISEKDGHKDEKSPAGETGNEEISPTCSVQSSDAFADISSTMTSEHVGLSLSSPTKVTVKYSGPDVATGFGEIHSDVITSTTSTGLISVEPNLPEKITILSSGVSSSSEDTLRLESGKIHVITSNIQATPEAQHAKLVTAVQVQSTGGLPLESEADKAASWTVQDSQSSKRSIFGRYFVRETSREKIESKETIVVTKQITHSSEPISGETASSIQRLKDSVHSEKMRFFDGAEK